jgi:hypothetical protein
MTGNLHDGISLFGELTRAVELLPDSKEKHFVTCLLAPSTLLLIDEDDQNRGGFHRCDRRLK